MIESISPLTLDILTKISLVGFTVSSIAVAVRIAKKNLFSDIARLGENLSISATLYFFSLMAIIGTPLFDSDLLGKASYVLINIASLFLLYSWIIFIIKKFVIKTIIINRLGSEIFQE